MPQGSILSVTLSVVDINSVSHVLLNSVSRMLPDRVRDSLYVNDCQSLFLLDRRY